MGMVLPLIASSPATCPDGFGGPWFLPLPLPLPGSPTAIAATTALVRTAARSGSASRRTVRPFIGFLPVEGERGASSTKARPPTRCSWSDVSLRGQLWNRNPTRQFVCPLHGTAPNHKRLEEEH